MMTRTTLPESLHDFKDADYKFVGRGIPSFQFMEEVASALELLLKDYEERQTK